jgi:YesN/AraC family two-component response regulator
MRVLIIEDEIMARRSLEKLLENNFPDIEVVAELGSVSDSVAWLKAHPEAVDTIFMDVELSDGECFEVFRHVEVKVNVVMTTAYDNYAVNAFRVRSLDYLLKPIDYVELDRILTQLVKRLRERKPHAQPETVMETGQEKNAAENDVVQAVKDYVRVHIRDTIYIGDIAASVFLNEQHLMRIFKRETGVSVLEYITGERLAVSKRLLITTALPVNQVALQAGYENYSYFIRLFKRNFGVTPQVYRQSGGKTNE